MPMIVAHLGDWGECSWRSSHTHSGAFEAVRAFRPKEAQLA
jgi:hypothetical protein